MLTSRSSTVLVRDSTKLQTSDFSRGWGLVGLSHFEIKWLAALRACPNTKPPAKFNKPASEDAIAFAVLPAFLNSSFKFLILPAKSVAFLPVTACFQPKTSKKPLRTLVVCSVNGSTSKHIIEDSEVMMPSLCTSKCQSALEILSKANTEALPQTAAIVWYTTSSPFSPFDNPAPHEPRTDSL